MIPVSDSCKKACNSDSLKYREFIIVDGTEVDIKGQLSATAYKDTTFFGTFNMKTLKFEADNSISYKKKEVVYYKEINNESFKIGTFIVTEISDSDTYDMVTVTAYDYGLKFANTYVTSLNYDSGNITLAKVAKEICKKLKVELKSSIFPNSEFIVDSNQFSEDSQYGDVISAIAMISGTFATINNNDQLEFIFNKKYEDEFLAAENSDLIETEAEDLIIMNGSADTIDDYEELEDKRDTRPITCVIVAPSEDLASAGATKKDEELIKKYGENWLRIYGNPFAYSTEKCSELVEEIFNSIKGFGYSAFTTKYSFKPYLTLGDLVKFKNKAGEYINSVILRITTDYDDITLEAPSITDSSVEYEQVDSYDEEIKKANIKIDQANSQIVLKINNDGKIAAIKLNGSADDGTVITLEADQLNLTGNDIINLIAGNTLNLTSKNITIESNNFSVSSNGNIKANNGEFSGTINSSSGKIANFTIEDGRIYSGSGSQQAGIGLYGKYYAFWAGGSDSSSAPFRVDHNGYLTATDATINGGNITIYDDGKYGSEYELEIINTSNNSIKTEMFSGGANFINDSSTTEIYGGQIIGGVEGYEIVIGSGFGVYNNNTTYFEATTTAVSARNFKQLSLATEKKDFELLDNALDIIKNIDIYKFRLKEENDTKKHIGFIIGDDYKYSQDITSNENDGVDLYSMISVAYKAIQEQQEHIENLEKRIEELENKNE